MIIKQLQNHARAERSRLDEDQDAFVKFWINRDSVIDVEDGGEHYDRPPAERNAGWVRGTWYLMVDPTQGKIRDLALDGTRDDLMAALPLALREYPSDRVILDISSETYGVTLTPRQANVFAKTGKTPGESALVERETIQSGQVASLAYLVNPTARDLLGLMQVGMRERGLNYGEFRALIARDGTVYAWDAHKGAHYGCWKDLMQQGCDMGTQDEVACIHITWIPEVYRGRVARPNRTTPPGSIMRGMAYTLKHKHLIIADLPSETWQLAYRGLQRLARVEEQRIQSEVGAPLVESKPQWSTPEFKAWFGNSVVRDSKGNPRIVYHGTYGDFNVFDHDEVAYRGGILAFFSTGPKFASNYANTMSQNGEPIGGTVMPCYLRIERPFDFRNRWDIAAQFFDENGGINDDHQARLILSELKWGPYKDPNYDGYGSSAPGSDALTGDLFVKAVRKGCWTALEYPDFVEWLKHEGFDGLITKEARSINYAVFDPNQIKSAVGNTGSFNYDSPSIIESRREEVTIGKEGYGREIPVLFDPSAAEMAAFVQNLKYGEARSLYVKEKSEWVLAVWDAYESDHVQMAEALRRTGWTVNAKLHLEFSAENKGFASINIARSGLIQYGPIWGTPSRIFRQSWLAQRLIKMGSGKSVDGNLNESPLVDYDYMQDPERNAKHALMPGTVKIAQSAKAKAKAVRMFANTPYNIRVIFYDNRQPVNRRGERLSGFIGKIPEPDYFPGVEATAGVITFVLHTDVGDNFRQFSPWMIAHRIGHTMTGVRNQGLMSAMAVFIDDSAEIMHDMDTAKFYGMDQLLIYGLYNKIGKFKSARDMSFRDRGEFFIDCFAQFLIQGQVSLNRLQVGDIIVGSTQPLHTGPFKLKGDYEPQRVEITAQTVDTVNQDIEYMERHMNKRFAAQLESMIGEVWTV